MLRQGDILLVPATAPEHFERRHVEQAVLGYGEATGHTHTLECVEWLVAPETSDEDLHQFALGAKDMTVFIVTADEVYLTHQEHAAVIIPPGVWQVIRQRVYSPQAILSVID